jgi:hypothetical protein
VRQKGLRLKPGCPAFEVKFTGSLDCRTGTCQFGAWQSPGDRWQLSS